MARPRFLIWLLVVAALVLLSFFGPLSELLRGLYADLYLR